MAALGPSYVTGPEDVEEPSSVSHLENIEHLFRLRSSLGCAALEARPEQQVMSL